MAAINKSLASVTLCFLFALAAAHSNNVALIVHGQAKCKKNPTAVINNTPLRLRINGTIVPGAGKTTSTSQIVMTVTLTSPEQIDSVLCNSSQVVLVAPPHACGVKYLPPGKVVGALVQVEAVHSCDVKILKGGHVSGRVQPTIAASDNQDFQCIKSIVARASEFFCVF